MKGGSASRASHIQRTSHQAAWPKHKPLHRSRHAVLVVAGCDSIRGRQRGRPRIANRNTQAAEAQHLDVVLSIAQRHAGGRVDA